MIDTASGRVLFDGVHSIDPSLGLAAKFGFQRIGSHIDEVDGLEEIFERVVA